MPPKRVPPASWVPEGTHIDRFDPMITARQNLPRVALGKNVWDLALERTEYVLDTHDRAVVMFSGGKDSTSVLNVALRVLEETPRLRRHLPLRVVFHDEEAIPYETEEYVRRVAARDDVALEWYCLPVKHRNACSREYPFWWPWAPEDREKWCRPLPAEAITEHPGFPVWPQSARFSIPQFNGPLCPPPATTALLMGIRAQESLIRSSSVRRKRVDNYIVPYFTHRERPTGHPVGHINKCYPIYDWKWADVWAATAQMGWDYNAAYDLLEMAGIQPSQQRCSPAFGEEPLQKIHTYAQCFPDVWARMAERVPGIGAAYRYALTELYGYREKPRKPAGMPYPEFVLHYARQHAPEVQPKLAKRLREVVTRHYKMTSDPILPNKPHPVTGTTWRFILNLAMRGDMKSRRQEKYDLKHRALPKLWERYAAELRELVDAGWTAEELGHPRPLPDPGAVIPAEWRQRGEE